VQEFGKRRQWIIFLRKLKHFVMKQRTVVDNTCHEVTFRISVLLCNNSLYYISIMYTVRYGHINCLRLKQHLMHLLYIPRYIMFYAFRRTSAPFSGVSYLTIRFSDHRLAWSDLLVKRGLLTDAEDRTLKYETTDEGTDLDRNA